VNINEALLSCFQLDEAEGIKGGMAWHYKYYDKNPEWAKIENEARHNRVGLWADDKPIAPWDYRNAQREGRY
jgi:micrococcal nuclease